MAADHRAAVHAIFEMFNTGDTAAAEEIIAADCIDHESKSGVGGTGPAMLQQTVALFRGAFPDLRMHIEDLVVEGDLAAARVRMSGTHKGDFAGIPATNKSFQIEAMDFLRFRGGQVVEHWGLSDDMSMTQQLGLMQAQE
jgi:steroid delta-isomerase-like uncharacterized protein